MSRWHLVHGPLLAEDLDVPHLFPGWRGRGHLRRGSNRRHEVRTDGQYQHLQQQSLSYFWWEKLRHFLDMVGGRASRIVRTCIHPPSRDIPLTVILVIVTLVLVLLSVLIVAVVVAIVLLVPLVSVVVLRAIQRRSRHHLVHQYLQLILP